MIDRLHISGEVRRNTTNLALKDADHKMKIVV
jgi:hypothetical protein